MLVDIPGDRTSGMQDLGFFGETDRWKYSEDDLVSLRVEESIVWAAIVEKFGESLGKIRIYVHPAAKDTIRAIGPEKLSDYLWTALADFGLA